MEDRDHSASSATLSESVVVYRFASHHLHHRDHRLRDTATGQDTDPDRGMAALVMDHRLPVLVMVMVPHLQDPGGDESLMGMKKVIRAGNGFVQSKISTWTSGVSF